MRTGEVVRRIIMGEVRVRQNHGLEEIGAAFNFHASWFHPWMIPADRDGEVGSWSMGRREPGRSKM